MKRIEISFLILFLTLSQFSSLRASADLSNRLPTALVREMIEAGLWHPQFEDPKSSEYQEIASFLASVNSGTAPAIDRVLLETTTSNLYSHKIAILRYLVTAGNIQSRAPAIAFRNQWVQQYVGMAIEIMRLSTDPEFLMILRNFEQMWNEDRVQVVDLDPSLRNELKINELHSRDHDVQLTARDSSGRHSVTGFYNHNRQLLAVDLSRPLNDTLVTLAHEIVHAADPRLWEARVRLGELESQVIATLTRLLGDIEHAQDLSESLLNQVLFETGFSDYANIISESRRTRIRNLEKAVSEASSSRISPADKKLLRRYFQLVIELSIGNEYRAYGMSLLFYMELKNQYNLIPPSKERLKTIEAFLSGDQIFLANLAFSMNPFKEQRALQLFSHRVDPRLPDLLQYVRNQVSIAQASNSGDTPNTLELSSEEKILLGKYRRMLSALNHLEIAYLSSLEEFIQSLSRQFSSQLRRFQSLSDDQLIPYFARPGGLESPMNPLQILSARFTTAWVIRFRSSMNDFYQDLVQLNEPFVTSSFGLLDLHDVSFGERQLLGLAYTNIGSRDSMLSAELRISYADLPPALKEEFDLLMEFNVQSDRTQYLTQDQVQARLLRFRLIKNSQWIDENLPLLRATLTSVNNFIELIERGSFDKKEISEERAQELRQELLMALGDAQLSRREVERMSILVSLLQGMINWANHNGRTSTAADLEGRIQKLLTVFSNLRVYGATNDQEVLSQLAEWRAQYGLAIRPFIDDCKAQGKRNPNSVIWQGSASPLQVGPYSFRIAGVCYGGRFYPARQPNDDVRGMASTTLSVQDQNGRPRRLLVSRIMDESPQVALNPALEPERQLRKNRTRSQD